ncbi:MAG: DUF3500 domain-containing protein [Limisphaerales bacterium]
MHFTDLGWARPSSLGGWRRVAGVGLLVMGLGLGGPVRGHEVPEVAAEMAEAANRFRAALTPEQQARAVWKLEEAERRNWHYVPRERQGLSLQAMTPAQRHLAAGLLSTGLSHRAYLKATTIMSLEEVLKELEKGRGPVRDPELYYFTVFGEPAATGTWGWRVEGHHLALNFTLVDGKEIRVTPSFLGSNPGEVRAGSRAGLRVLAAEEDLGRALVKSLTAEQRAVAVVNERAPGDVLNTPDRRAGTLSPLGLAATRLNAEQVRQLQQLIEEYVRRYRPELAAEDLRKIAATGWDGIHFAWAGGLEPRQPHYYRIQGPGFCLEYDNTQNDANHIHTVWRDFTDDFGEDALRRHYETSPHHR